MITKYCPICSSVMNRGIQDWHQECPKCKYESAEMIPAINNTIASKNIDEFFREKGLQSLRIKNFNKLLNAIEDIGIYSGKLLDVGCAHGWFLEISHDRGFQSFGIEPDFNIYNKTKQKGLSIRKGFFPDSLSVEEQFNVITFNDVFEHIPDIKNILAGCKNHLTNDGILVLNLPNSTGFFYNIARLFSKFGFERFFERLWQKELPSPHLHYFNLKNLQNLLQDNDFEVIRTGQLSTLRLKGLFKRISYTGNYSLPVRLFIYSAAVLILPVLFLFPSDIIFLISKKIN